MQLDLANKKICAEYDKFIEDSDFGNFMQSRQWSYVKDNWDHQYFYLEEDGKITAALSLISVKDSITGKRFFYVPRGPVCDFHNIEQTITLIEEVKVYARENDGFLLRIEPNVPDDPQLLAQYADRGYRFLKNPALVTQPLMSMVLEINGRTADQILNDYKSDARYEIRSAYRQGIELHTGGRSDLEVFSKMMIEMSERKGIGYRPLSYFERLYDAYSDSVRLHFASYEGELIAASFLIGFGKTLTLIYAADPLYVRKNQSALLQFENIKYAVDKGYSFYDMGGIFSTKKTDGLYKFKKKFAQTQISWIGNLDIALDQAAYDAHKQSDMENFDWSKVDITREEAEAAENN